MDGKMERMQPVASDASIAYNQMDERKHVQCTWLAMPHPHCDNRRVYDHLSHLNSDFLALIIFLRQGRLSQFVFKVLPITSVLLLCLPKIWIY
jgi:hypothetical protein